MSEVPLCWMPAAVALSATSSITPAPFVCGDAWLVQGREVRSQGSGQTRLPTPQRQVLGPIRGRVNPGEVNSSCGCRLGTVRGRSGQCLDSYEGS